MLDFFVTLVPEDALKLVSNSWTIPAGIVVLFFYGRAHFNSPTYPIELVGSNGNNQNDRVRLIAQVPPIFTTRRSRYNSYSLRYISALIFAFLLIIFAYPVLRDIARADAITLPDLTNESVEYRSILALLLLTGLLSSFPGLKDIDAWVIRTLHREAFIPDDVRDFAAKLVQSIYIPSANTRTAVRPTLAMRDTARVADAAAVGSLERRIYELLCARTQIRTVMKEEAYRRVRIQFDQDINSMESQAQSLKLDIINYLRQQEKVVPPDVPDIDAFIFNNIDKDGMKDLLDRRNSLLSRCDTQYELVCLMAGLALFATTSAAEEIDTAVKKMGFEARVDRVPALDWDAVVKVTVSAILVLLIFNGLYAVIWNDLNLISVIPSAEPTKTNIIRFAILFTIAYTIIMWLAIQLKRRWRRVSQLEKRPENLLIACVSYISTVWINLIINYYVTGGHLTYAPLLFALNQAVFGYFVGIYIDRHVDNKALSIRLAIYQGCAQAVAVTIATTFSPSLVLSELSPFVMLRIGLIMSVFSMLQSGISGFVVGVLFQKVYNKSPRAFPESAVGGAYPGQESKGEQTDRMVARASL